MPRYVFELIDGSKALSERECADAAAAREEALTSLGEMVRFELPDGDHRTFTVKVTDETRATVLTASLALMVTYPARSRSAS